MQPRILLFILLSVSILPCSLSIQNTAAHTLAFSGVNAYEYVLRQLSFGPRIPGSAALLATASYIKDNLTTSGWHVSLQNFTYHNQLLNADVTGHNVIATWRPLIRLFGSDSPRIILGAHYDTRPFADASNSDNHTAPVLGANDGASGVAVLLELGRLLPTIPGYTGLPGLTVVFFDAEDSGMLGSGWIEGSTSYVESLTPSEKSGIGAVIILDMIGDSDLHLRREASSDYALSEAIWSHADMLGYTQFEEGIVSRIIDDHTPFLQDGIRAVDIIDFDYPYWHTPYDTTDKVSPASLEAVGRTIEAFLETSIPPYALPVSFYAVLGGLLTVTGAAFVLLLRARGRR